MQTENKIIKHLGNAFIALSFLGTVCIYYPVIRGYFFPSNIPLPVNASVISIEKINAIAPIIHNVDPWNKQEYLEALKSGVAHAKGSYFPGEAGSGTVYLFAHSSDAPWRLTRYNTIFLRLHELQYDDEIVIRDDDKTYTYRVREKKTVWPHETEYLTDLEKDQLILQTCAPVGTDLMRLLIFAEPVS